MENLRDICRNWFEMGIRGYILFTDFSSKPNWLTPPKHLVKEPSATQALPSWACEADRLMQQFLG